MTHSLKVQYAVHLLMIAFLPQPPCSTDRAQGLCYYFMVQLIRLMRLMQSLCPTAPAATMPLHLAWGLCRVLSL